MIAAPRTPTLAYYVSGHGFGHASRSIEIINTLGAIRPDVRMVIRTSAAAWLFDVTLRVVAPLESAETDTGVVQRDSLSMDLDATIDTASAFYHGFSERADAEVAWLRRAGVTVVASDIPPLAFEAAARAGVPSVGIANFTWDWIYEGYPELGTRAPHVIPTIRRAHAQASLGLRLPLHGGFDGWSAAIEDLPFVARHSRRDRGEIRTTLGVGQDTRLVLASFGGLGLSAMNFGPLGTLSGYTILTTGHALRYAGTLPANVRVLEDGAVYEMGLRYEDLVHAADVVVSKPGYGILAECLAHDTALLYTSRGRFVEYDVLVREMPTFLRCAFIDQQALLSGIWQDSLDRLMDQPPPPRRPPTDGATIAATRLADLL